MDAHGLLLPFPPPRPPPGGVRILGWGFTAADRVTGFLELSDAHAAAHLLHGDLEVGGHLPRELRASTSNLWVTPNLPPPPRPNVRPRLWRRTSNPGINYLMAMS